MRVVIGFLLILVGSLFAYKVLTGSALPALTPTATPTPSTSPSFLNTQGGGTMHAPGHGYTSSTGLPTFTGLTDLQASKGLGH